jgi:hypothetical protein
MRKALIALAAVAVVAAVGLYVALRSLDSIVAGAIEKRGSELTGTAVRVESVEIVLSEGRARIVGLTVANPPGFSSAEAFRLGEIEARIDTGTLAGSPIVIEEIRIEAPRVSFEVDAEGQSNVEIIRRQAERSGKKRRDGEPGGSDRGGSDRDDSDRGGILLVVDRLSIVGGEVEIDARAMGGKAETSALPSIELTGIGRRENGLTPSEIGQTLAVALARNVAMAVVASQVERYVGEQLGGPAGDAVRKGGAGAIEKGLGGLLDKVLRKKKDR